MLYTLSENEFLINAIRSQKNLKPYFYRKAAKVGTYGSIVGFFLAYIMFFRVLSFFDIDINQPIRGDDLSSNLQFLVFGAILVVVSLYMSCAFFAAIYFMRSRNKGHISRDEYLAIIFKSTYPSHWQKGRKTRV